MALTALKSAAADPEPTAFRPLTPPVTGLRRAFEPTLGARMSLCKGGRKGGVRLAFTLGPDVLALADLAGGARVAILVAIADGAPLVWLRRAGRHETPAYRLRVSKGCASGVCAFIAPLDLPLIGAATQPHRAAPGGGVFVEPTGEIANAVRRIAALRETAQ